jgi:molybdopterin converting factor small subunit
MNITVTIKHGLTGRLTKEVEMGTTVGQLIRDPNTRGSLGYGENVNALINGDSVGMDEEVEDGDVILIQKSEAKKA